MSTFFTADLHFGHANIIRYCGRPFADADEMDAEIIKRCNKVVTPNDTLYILGDLGFLSVDEQIKRISQMNGKKHLIWGNHDAKGYQDRQKLVDACFVRADDLRRIKANYRGADGYMRAARIVLCHYAMRVWDGSFHGSWHLYGHSHGTLPDNPYSLSFDVGVDCWDFYPVSISEVAETMAKKSWTPPKDRKEGHPND